jgi:hypothetical protein
MMVVMSCRSALFANGSSPCEEAFAVPGATSSFLDMTGAADMTGTAGFVPKRLSLIAAQSKPDQHNQATQSGHNNTIHLSSL